jgi:protein TonB
MKAAAGAQKRRPAAVPHAPAARPLRHLTAARPGISPRGVADARLKIALSISLLLHAIVLIIHFSFPADDRLAKDKPLEVVLVNSKTHERPQDAQALAQANLDGGGNTDEDRRAKTPLPVSRQQKEGSQLESAQQRVRELEARQRMLIAQARAPVKAIAQPEAREVQPDKPPEVSGLDLASSAMAMARLQAQIERNIDDYNKRPRKKFIGARTEEYRFAQYVEDWRSKVERIGTLNYPDAARGKLYGSLILTVIVRADGSIDAIEINRSSGHKVLDEAARRIVQMAGPYAAFPPDIRRDTDVLEITRTWFFTRDDQVRAN